MKLDFNQQSTLDKKCNTASKRFVALASWSLFTVMVGVVVIDILKLPEVFTWFIQGSIIFVILNNVKSLIKKNNIDTIGYNIVSIFIQYLLFNVIRGMYYAEGYWMWKAVFIQLFISLFYSVVLLATNIQIIQQFYKKYWKYSLLFITICLLINRSPLVFDYVPFSSLLLFLPIIPTRKRWMLLSIVILYLMFLYQRNDFIKISVTFSIGIYVMLFHKIVPNFLIKLTHILFFITPIILLWLGSSGIFNIFKMDEYIKGDHIIKVETTEGVSEESLTGDTRTFIYRNVYSTIKRHDDWLIGRSPAFGDEGVGSYYGKDDKSGLIGRYGNEVGIMDIFLWYGIIGVILYFLIYLRSSYLAIYRSKNKYSKGIGLYVSFLWTWSFVWEKPLFETFFLIDLILLGLCLSLNFRQMNDAEVKTWVGGIFQRKRKRIKNKIINYEDSLDLKRNISRSL